MPFVIISRNQSKLITLFAVVLSANGYSFDHSVTIKVNYGSYQGGHIRVFIYEEVYSTAAKQKVNVIICLFPYLTSLILTWLRFGNGNVHISFGVEKPCATMPQIFLLNEIVV